MRRSSHPEASSSSPSDNDGHDKGHAYNLRPRKKWSRSNAWEEKTTRVTATTTQQESQVPSAAAIPLPHLTMAQWNNAIDQVRANMEAHRRSEEANQAVMQRRAIEADEASARQRAELLRRITVQTTQHQQAWRAAHPADHYDCEYHAEQQLNKLRHLMHVDEPEGDVPDISSYDVQVVAAADIRACMDKRIPTLKSICAVCSTFQAPEEIAFHELSHIPSLGLLDKDMAPSKELPAAKCPRDALTVYAASNGVTYCLQPAVCRDEAKIPICKGCYRELSNGHIPHGSLVRVDTGSIPEPQRELLPPLSLMEERLLGIVRVARFVYVLRWTHDALGTRQHQLKGHVIGVMNPAIEELLQVLPADLSTLAEDIQIVFIVLTALENKATCIRELAKNTPAVHVRGPVVARWGRRGRREGERFDSVRTCGMTPPSIEHRAPTGERAIQKKRAGRALHSLVPQKAAAIVFWV
mmetsp:Transcript_28865/g.85455  ORF Transcript_28865/g.85455 Transcript_28865/m.85455 type:complete len:468 (-) Transcript_28865:6838-8241(-)